MKAPFLKFVAEGRVVRRPGELSRYTFQEICEKIYISFLSLSLLKRFSQTSRWARQYGRETMTYGGFDKVRYSANDLHNMLAVVDGDPAIALKLSNSNAAQALRQRQSVPTLIVKRYLRMMQDDYGFLTAMETALGITNGDYKNLRRAIADFDSLDTRRKKITVTRLLQAVRAKLPGTDISRKVEEFSKKQKFELDNVLDAETGTDTKKMSGDELNAYRILVGPANIRRAKMAVELAKDGKSIPANVVSAYVPIMRMVDDIANGGFAFVRLLQSIHERAKKNQKR
jgi:hypothetical protein|tara:strand:+ start:5082 stop:5936 length:855 start_codon:yes stop_codon:yes gene_type:complete